MQLPLRLQLKKSPSYSVFLASGHILAGVAVCLLQIGWGWRVLLLLGIGAAFGHALRRTARYLPSLHLRADGKLEMQLAGTAPVLAEVAGDTLVWPGVVVLHLRACVDGELADGKRLKPLVVFFDALTEPDAHRQLRLWLRWCKRADMP